MTLILRRDPSAMLALSRGLGLQPRRWSALSRALLWHAQLPRVPGAQRFGFAPRHLRLRHARASDELPRRSLPGDDECEIVLGKAYCLRPE